MCNVGMLAGMHEEVCMHTETVLARELLQVHTL